MFDDGVQEMYYYYSHIVHHKYKSVSKPKNIDGPWDRGRGLGGFCFEKSTHPR